MVEFTLIFILLLVVAWIPADFGLALFTGHIAQNASREGARIAAADPTLAVGTTTCNMPCTGATGVLKVTSDRMSAALLPGAEVKLEVQGGTTCDRLVTVTIDGDYNFFFYQVLRLMAISVPSTVEVTRTTSMRWEHQC